MNRKISNTYDDDFDSMYVIMKNAIELAYRRGVDHGRREMELEYKAREAGQRKSTDISTIMDRREVYD